MQIVCGRGEQNGLNPVLAPFLKTVGHICDVPESPIPKKPSASELSNSKPMMKKLVSQVNRDFYDSFHSYGEASPCSQIPRAAFLSNLMGFLQVTANVRAQTRHFCSTIAHCFHNFVENRQFYDNITSLNH